MLEALRAEVLEANLELVRRGLVIYTFGNASGVSREQGLIVIKPSGVPYDRMKPEHMVITDLEGRVVEGDLKPSSDMATHALLYREFPTIGGVAHSHSRHATSWAQAGREIPCFGTTHADYFCGAVPVTDPLTAEEIESAYELNTGRGDCAAHPRARPSGLPGDSGDGPRTVRVGQHRHRGGTQRRDRGRTGGHGVADHHHQSRGAAHQRDAARQASLPQARGQGDVRPEVSATRYRRP